MRWLWLFPSLLAGWAGYVWVTLDAWGKIDNGLLVFLGLLAAAVVQIIPVTANFLQADHLTTVEATKLSKALERQQYFWVGFLLLVVTMAGLLIAARFVNEALPADSAGWLRTGLPRLLSAFLAAGFIWVIALGGALVSEVLGLQRLRSQLVILAAKRRADETVRREKARIETLPSITPEGYGEIVRH